MPMATPPLLTADFPIDNQETEPKRAKSIGQKVAIRKAFIAPLHIRHISSDRWIDGVARSTER